MNKCRQCLVIADFNSANFSGYLENNEESPEMSPLTGEFGQVLPVLTQLDSKVWQNNPEYALVWTQPGKVIPSFSKLLSYEKVPMEEIFSEVDEFAAAVIHAGSRLKAVWVPTWVLDASQRGLGMADWRESMGLAHTLARMNLRLAENFAASPHIFLLDAQRWLTQAGATATPAKLWYQSKTPFANRVFQEAVRDIKAAVRGLDGQARKLIVIDLDDTLWGGVVGDVGWRNLRLGGHDPTGEALVDFQLELKALQNRGILLGVVSKNDESVALEAIRQHPEMKLKLEDLAGWRINWEDKASNLVQLTEELNLGLQSVVFIDDHPIERARVREALPEVFVPEWPDNPMLYPTALRSLRCFDMPTVSQEDTRRTQAYADERQRSNLKRVVGSVDGWLRSLNIKVTAESLKPENLPRAAQLLNKTNQMNLRTRRLSEVELDEWTRMAGHYCWVFRVTDRFGDAGLTGIASLEINGALANIEDFVLSCRVMGRKVEETMIHWLVEQSLKNNAREIVAEYLPTAKNNPCLEFWRRSGFSEKDSTFYRRNEASYPLPDCIQLIIAGA